MPDESVPRYRYEAKIRVVLAADGLDHAYRMQQQIVGVIERHTNKRVVSVDASMLDLKHRPDLDGSLASRDQPTTHRRSSVQ